MRFFVLSPPAPAKANATPPSAIASSKPTMINRLRLMRTGPSRLRRVERVGEFAVEPEIARAVPEGRTGDAGTDMAPAYLARIVLTLDFIGEQVLRDDDVAFAANHFRDIGDAPRAVAQTLCLHDDVHGADDHLANGLGGQRKAAHGDERFETRQRLARRVRVHRSHRAVMA